MNTSLPEGQRIRKFVLLYKELDADDGELTRTRKVRRCVIAPKNAGSIIGTPLFRTPLMSTSIP